MIPLIPAVLGRCLLRSSPPPWVGSNSRGPYSAMRINCGSRVFSAALMMGLAAVAYGQSPDVEAGNLTSEVTALKTENVALREQLNRVEEQQKMMLEVVNDLKQRLGSPATPIVGGPSSSSQQNFAAARELA